MVWLVAWGIIALFLLVVGVSFFLTEYKYTRLELNGGADISYEEILALTGLQFPMQYTKVHAHDIEQKLIAHPHIEQAIVHKRLTSTLEIELRYATPLVYVQDVQKNNIHYFDSQGRYIHKSASLITNTKLPIVELRGIDLEFKALGYILPEHHHWYLSQLGVLQERAFFENIGSLHVASNEDGVEVKLYVQDFEVPFLLTRIDESTIAKLVQFSRTISKYNVSNTIAFFDIRSGFIIGKENSGKQERL